MIRRYTFPLLLVLPVMAPAQQQPAPRGIDLKASDGILLKATYFAAAKELRGRGVTVQKPSVAGYGMKQMYLHDPDGYSLCFQWSAQP